MGLRNWVRRWLGLDSGANQVPPPSEPLASPERNTSPTFRVSLVPAINGKVLEIGTYKPNPRGPDWTFELFIVPENATVASAIATVMAMKAVEN